MGLPRTRVLALAVALAATAIVAPTANAASTRAEYVAQVEPICKAAFGPEAKAYYGNVRAAHKLYLQLQRGAPRRQAYSRYFRRAVKFLGRRHRLYAQETSLIAAVPPAPGDEAIVAGWLAKRTESAAFLSHAIVAARHHKFSNMAQLDDLSGAAEADGEELVADFGFRYCTPIPSDI